MLLLLSCGAGRWKAEGDYAPPSARLEVEDVGKDSVVIKLLNGKFCTADDPTVTCNSRTKSEQAVFQVHCISGGSSKDQDKKPEKPASSGSDEKTKELTTKLKQAKLDRIKAINADQS